MMSGMLHRRAPAETGFPIPHADQPLRVRARRLLAQFDRQAQVYGADDHFDGTTYASWLADVLEELLDATMSRQSVTFRGETYQTHEVKADDPEADDRQMTGGGTFRMFRPNHAENCPARTSWTSDTCTCGRVTEWEKAHMRRMAAAERRRQGPGLMQGKEDDVALDSYHRLAEQKEALRQALWLIAGEVAARELAATGESPEGVADADVIQAARLAVASLAGRSMRLDWVSEELTRAGSRVRDLEDALSVITGRLEHQQARNRELHGTIASLRVTSLREVQRLGEVVSLRHVSERLQVALSEAEKARDELAGQVRELERTPLAWHAGTHGWDSHDGYPRHGHSVNGAATINPAWEALHGG